MKRSKSPLSFGGCDYLGLSGDARLLRALNEGAREFGLSRSASRRTSGDHLLYHELEIRLAAFAKAEAAVLLPSGYLTNLALAQILPPGLAVIKERLTHPSIDDAIELLNAPLTVSSIAQPSDLPKKLGPLGKNRPAILWVEGLKGTTGEIASIPDYLKGLRRTDWLVLDEAHSFGVLGQGVGLLKYFDLQPFPHLVRTMTFSKALGGFGGAVLGSRKICEAIRGKSRLFAGSTPFPLAMAKVNLTALEVIASEPERVASLSRKVTWLKEKVRAMGGPVLENPSPIIRFSPANSFSQRLLIQHLKKQNIVPPVIGYPPGAAPFFRFAISVRHSRKDLQRLLAALEGWLQEEKRKRP